MDNLKIVFFIDKIEFQYFEMNPLVTSFWLIKECNYRNWDVYISTLDRLSLKNSMPQASLFKTKLEVTGNKIELTREPKPQHYQLNDMDIVFFRPDPPVDLNYINATYILDFVDQTKTLVVNDSKGIRTANEKLYISNFPEMVPSNITTQSVQLLKEFLNEYNEIIIKPLNKCFGKGVFYLKKGDVNTNTILETSTDFGKNLIMAQEYLSSNACGDKRVNIICGHVMEEAIEKKPGAGDFKFNTHNDKYFNKSFLTDKEKEICTKIAPKLMEDGLYISGLDFIQDRIIEINVTSPCFFIKEVNNLFNTELEKTIIDHILNLYLSKNKKNLQTIK